MTRGLDRKEASWTQEEEEARIGGCAGQGDAGGKSLAAVHNLLPDFLLAGHGSSERVSTKVVVVFGTRYDKEREEREAIVIHS